MRLTPISAIVAIVCKRDSAILPAGGWYERPLDRLLIKARDGVGQVQVRLEIGQRGGSSSVSFGRRASIRSGMKMVRVVVDQPRLGLLVTDPVPGTDRRSG